MSLYVIGVGHAFPDGRISNSTINEIGLAITASEGEAHFVSERASTLPLDYIKDSKNIDTWAARSVATANASDLGVQAARLALERAGLTSENIGLVLGDCNTPIETTPCEAQRIGGKLAIRCPAYDMTTGVAGLAQMLETLLAWKLSKVPDYVLLVSSGVASQSVDYRSSSALTFSDGAAAMVIAKKPVSTAQTQFQVLDARTSYSEPCDKFVRFPISGHIEMTSDKEPLVVEAARQLIAEEPADYMYGTRYAAIADKNVVSCHREYGDCVGAAPVAALSLGAQKFSPASSVRLLFVGAGSRIGSISLISE
jgi:3-oxoacyl-[acyl-carrier-protein] synthase III